MANFKVWWPECIHIDGTKCTSDTGFLGFILRNWSSIELGYRLVRFNIGMTGLWKLIDKAAYDEDEREHRHFSNCCKEKLLLQRYRDYDRNKYYTRPYDETSTVKPLPNPYNLGFFWYRKAIVAIENDRSRHMSRKKWSEFWDYRDAYVFGELRAMFFKRNIKYGEPPWADWLSEWREGVGI
jgi:hypothetical protein